MRLPPFRFAGPQGTEAAALSLAYFDTVPLGVGMGVLRSGFLFLAAESGDHRLYQMAGLGATPERALLDRHLVVHQGRDEVGRVPLFAPTTSLTNLRLVDMLVSYAPLVCAAKVPTVGPGQVHRAVGCCARAYVCVCVCEGRECPAPLSPPQPQKASNPSKSRQPLFQWVARAANKRSRCTTRSSAAPKRSAFRRCVGRTGRAGCLCWRAATRD